MARRINASDDLNLSTDIETKENSLAPTDEESKNAGTSATGKVANSRYVRLRKAPSANAQVVTVLSNGEVGKILDLVPGFYKIEVIATGKIGFVPVHYFKED